MARRRSSGALPLLLAIAALVVGACGGGEGTTTSGSGGTGTAAGPGAAGAQDLRGSITVFAAASLTDAFEEVGGAFEDRNPGTTVVLQFAASSTLREQVLAGAPAEVFASADASNMDALVEAGATATDPRTFVTNGLQIAVPRGNPGHVTGLEDFADAGLLIGLCAEAVPCGAFSHEALDNAGVDAAVDTEEPDVRSLLTKIIAGELDAGIVYRTDVLAAGDAVEGVDIPASQNVTARYPIAPLGDAGRPDVAAAFVDFVLSNDGQHILQSYGFGPP